MKNRTQQQNRNNEVLLTISKDRQRTNILKHPEQRLIAFLVQRIPNWVSSNMLTTIGLLGNATVGFSFVLAYYWGAQFLLIGILGLMLNWFGDSLDGRIAYFRNKSRKWYGFTLDIIVDLIGIVLIGIGVIIYIEPAWEVVGYLFVVLYLWEMVLALLRYKVSDTYSIDSGFFSPTEVRIVIGLILILEVLFSGTLKYSASIACTVLLILNLTDSRKLLKVADMKDKGIVNQ